MIIFPALAVVVLAVVLVRADRRLTGNLLLGVGASFVFGMVTMGGGIEPVIAAAAAVLLVAGALVRRTAAARGGSDRWAMSANTASEARPPEPEWRGAATTRSLGRVEVRELLRSPWTAAGIGLTIFEIVLFGFVFNEDYSQHWWATASMMPLLVHPMVGLTMVAAHRSTTRARRDGCIELFDTCPVPEGQRLVAGLVPMAAVVMLVMTGAAVLLGVIVTKPEVYGSYDLRLVASLATCGALGAGGVALGVALGRWAPFALAPAVALFVVVFLDDKLLQIGGQRWSTDRLLATFTEDDLTDQLLLDLPHIERLAWFLGLTAAVAGIALLGRHRAAVPATAGGLGVAGLAALGVMAPMANPSALAARITDPTAGEICIDAGSGSPTVSVCGPEEYIEGLRLIAADVAVTQLLLPDGDPVLLRMRLLDVDVAELPAELAAELDAGAATPDDGAVDLSISTHPEARLAAQMLLAARALDLPIRPDADLRPTSLAGRADGVAVLWLGTRGSTDDGVRRALTINPDDHAGEEIDATVRGQIWPDPCTVGPAPLMWAPEDAEAAQRLHALDDRRVLAVLHERWNDLAGLTTDQLLVLVGAEPVGSTSSVEERPHVCDW